MGTRRFLVGACMVSLGEIGRKSQRKIVFYETLLLCVFPSCSGGEGGVASPHMTCCPGTQAVYMQIWSGFSRPWGRGSAAVEV